MIYWMVSATCYDPLPWTSEVFAWHPLLVLKIWDARTLAEKKTDLPIKSKPKVRSISINCYSSESVLQD